ncbi:MAG: P-loop NTPase family protein [Candidatus Dormibacteria bacterium]
MIDTHPGAASLTYAAMAAADLVVVPVVLAGRELDALEGMLAEAAEFRLLLVPIAWRGGPTLPPSTGWRSWLHGIECP